MTPSHPSNSDRLHDLLASRALAPLSKEESIELEALLEGRPPEEIDLYESIATLLDPAMDDSAAFEPLPQSLRAKVDDDAILWAAKCRGLSLVGQQDQQHEAPGATPVIGQGSRWAWLVAAASLLLAVLVMFPRTNQLTPGQEYQSLAGRQDTTAINWVSTDGSVVQGDIIWDQESQTGVMRFKGLAANDPSQVQYQLWIFDESRRAQGHPAVDGGVFDIQQVNGDTFVRVHAKLDVQKPYLFAVTTEPPGGVVEHVDYDEFRIVLTAAVQG